MSFDRKAYFTSRLRKYQDRNPDEIPKSLIEELDTYMQLHYKFPPASEIRLMPLDSNGHRGSFTSIDILSKTLKYIAKTMYYRDLDLICKVLWGWENSTELEKKLVDEYVKLTETYGKEVPPIRTLVKPSKDYLIRMEQMAKDFNLIF